MELKISESTLWFYLPQQLLLVCDFFQKSTWNTGHFLDSGNPIFLKMTHVSGRFLKKVKVTTDQEELLW